MRVPEEPQTAGPVMPHLAGCCPPVLLADRGARGLVGPTGSLCLLRRVSENVGAALEVSFPSYLNQAVRC